MKRKNKFFIGSLALTLGISAAIPAIYYGIFLYDDSINIDILKEQSYLRFNSSKFIKNNGSIGSLIIDPIGSIIGSQYITNNDLDFILM